ncbi:hypothetical protein Dsin_016428 [Dipteronia sinensis]|uniref:Uncharacterized protein n=1 Tax=Dipteronia sinensis TaxID=43782 RepID=A0AAE0AE89_9ROSI|nr:hypothetical protein Dsin_016428 [Dipteronia sinensis]
MDSELEQLQSLGFFGTIKESFKILFPWKNIFTNIILTLVLPLSIFYLVQIEIADLISSKVSNPQSNTTTATTIQGSLSQGSLSHRILLMLIKSVGFFLFLTFYLLSKAATVYTIACIYTAKQTTYKKVISVTPRIWKKKATRHLPLQRSHLFILQRRRHRNFCLLVPFYCQCRRRSHGRHMDSDLLLCGDCVYQRNLAIACVVSVLEDKIGFKAMIKSRELIKGKMGVGVGTLILFGVCFGGICIIFERFVVLKWSQSQISIPVTIGCVVLLVPVTLLLNVVETIIYFVCKPYHQENIDKSSLSVHLEGYLEDCVKLNSSKDIQLEQQSNSRV